MTKGFFVVLSIKTLLTALWRRQFGNPDGAKNITEFKIKR